MVLELKMDQKGSGDKAYWNQNSATYVAWNWKAGGSASSNTDGINVQVQ